MSEFVVCEAEYTDADILKKALIELGVKESAIEVHETPVTLNGYHGTREGLKAHIVIRANKAGNSYDIGFEKQAKGYAPRVCDMDKHGIGGKILNNLKQKYAETVVLEHVRRKGGMRVVNHEKDKDGNVRITLRR